MSKQVNRLHQLELIILLEIHKCLEKIFKMPKATSKSVHVSYKYANEDLEDFSNSQEPPSENEFQEGFNTLHESSSDEEIV